MLVQAKVLLLHRLRGLQQLKRNQRRLSIVRVIPMIQMAMVVKINLTLVIQTTNLLILNKIQNMNTRKQALIDF
jgi:hypothetical protein